MRQHAPPHEVAAAVISITIRIIRIVIGIAVVAIGRAESKAEGKSRREAKSVVMKATEPTVKTAPVKTTPVEAASGGGFAGNQKPGHRDRCQHHRDVTEHDLHSPSTARMLTDRDGIQSRTGF
jgi:hypothetical protein